MIALARVNQAKPLGCKKRARRILFPSSPPCSSLAPLLFKLVNGLFGYYAARTLSRKLVRGKVGGSEFLRRGLILCEASRYTIHVRVGH